MKKNQILHTHSSHTVTTTHTPETALNSKHACIHLMTHTLYVYIYYITYMVILIIISELNGYACPQI